MTFPLHFDFIPYPLWRRRFSTQLSPIATRLTQLISAGRMRLDQPGYIDAVQMAHYLTQWGLLPRGIDAPGARRILENLMVNVALAETVAGAYTPPDTFTGLQIESFDNAACRNSMGETDAAPTNLRLPAQWEPMEAVIVTFPVLYPPLWATHAAMIAAITPVARVDILISKPEWAAAIRLALQDYEIVWQNVRFLHVATNDIWVRDYGPIVGIGADGTRVAIDAIFDPLDTYPQADDDHMPPLWADASDMMSRTFDLHIEGGNIWSDGAGTLIMSEEILHRHAPMTRDDIERGLKQVFAFDKLILTPFLWREETSHVDLVCKLADARTILVGAPTPFRNAERLRATAELFRRETNAASEPYQVIELPMPAPYLNWLVYPVWRSYTNALTINGRVIVPVFGISKDAEALAIYRHAMPDHDIIPINCAASSNGGGAVHCLTKEIPRGA